MDLNLNLRFIQYHLSNSKCEKKALIPNDGIRAWSFLHFFCFPLSIYIHIQGYEQVINKYLYGYCTSLSSAFEIHFLVKTYYILFCLKVAVAVTCNIFVYRICNVTTSNLSGCTAVRGFERRNYHFFFFANSRRKLLHLPEKVLRCNPLSKVIW